MTQAEVQKSVKKKKDNFDFECVKNSVVVEQDCLKMIRFV